MPLTGMGMGTGVDDTYLFDLDVLVQSADLRVAQDALDAYLSGAGPRSIRQAVYASRDTRGDALGVANCKARVPGWGRYATGFEGAGIAHLGAVVRLELIVSAVVGTSDLGVLRDAVKATLEARLAGVTCYDTVPSVTNLPAIVVIPRIGTFE
jgi:hypothetical protein